jgi:hypothetical protein
MCQSSFYSKKFPNCKKLKIATHIKVNFLRMFWKKSLKIGVWDWFAKFKRLIWIRSHQIATRLQHFFSIMHVLLSFNIQSFLGCYLMMQHHKIEKSQCPIRQQKTHILHHNNHTWWHFITCAMLQQLNLIIIYDNYNLHIGLTWSTCDLQISKCL